ncbi:hypothetical protein J2J97_31985 (plasmid) [Rhizobium bangladeshense]|uniref:hypothetical protein n=1 Tax=Rhizobium bangladeshense TaxID=1138189 RepID=UPI001A998177|nr:hypothetical protein [Rhizobium bangladeshense]QSY98693.1 hypothetical protein J2J97_31985 [Rhizobium bangladeshense]
MTKWKKGDIAVFKGYSDPNIAEADRLLQPGDRVTLVQVEADGAMGAMPIVAEGEPARDGDTVFEDEIMTVDEWQAANAPAEQVDPEVKADEEAAAAQNKKPAGKGKTKPAKTTAPVTAKVEDAEAAKAPSTGKVTLKGPEPTQQQLPGTGTEVLEVTHSSSVSALLQEKDALEAAKELVARAEETEFTLGGVLAHILREGIHRKLGYDGKRGFEDYIEKELGVKYRKARYLINIYEYFTALGVDETLLGGMGWSKAKELVGVATKETFDELVEFANQHTRDELIEEIRTKYVNAADGEAEQTTAKLTTWTFKLFDNQNVTVKRAIDAAMKQASTDKIGVALELVCGEWSMLSENNQMTLEEHIELLQARFDVRLSISHETADGQTDIEDYAGDENETEDAA